MEQEPQMLSEPRVAHGYDASHTPCNKQHSQAQLGDNTGSLAVQGEKRSEPPENTSDSASGPETLLHDDTYPEGGLEAWLVVLGSFCGLVASLGLMNSIAVFQTYNVAHQLSDFSEGTVGWIYSIYTFLAFGCGVYIGPLFDKYGPRWLILPGSLGVVASLMIMSVCTRKS
jgi:hypothetical protein